MAIKKLKTPATLAFFAIALVSCGDPMVRTQANRDAHFSEFKTYAWMSPAGHFAQGLPETPELAQRIQSAFDDEMKAKGFSLVAADQADLLLNYVATTEEKINAKDLQHYDTAEMMGLTYTLGSLGLRMTHGSPPVEVWRGLVQAMIDISRPRAERDRRLRDAVQAMLKKFPPK